MKEQGASRDARRLTLFIATGAVVLLTLLLLFPPAPLFEPAHAKQWLSVHLVLEISAVLVAALVVTVSWSSLESSPRRVFNGLVFGFSVAAFCDLLHALSYDGMPPFWSESSTSKAIFFWLIARSFEILALGLLAFHVALPGPPGRWLALAGVVSALMAWVGSVHLDWIPSTFVPGHGLTTFKVFFEYVLCLSNLAIAVVFWGAAQQRGRARDYWLATACFVMALGELVFASYHAPDDSLNVLGHVFKVVADALIFRAVFTLSIRQPYELARRTEKNLREREAQLAALARNLPHGVLFQVEREIDGSNRFVYVSESVERVMGLSGTQLLRDAQSWYRLIDPEDLPSLLASERESARTLNVLDVVLRVRGPDGVQRCLHLCSAPRRLDDGRTMWDGLALDITRQKADEEALRSNEAVLRAMADNMPFEAWVRDEAGRLVLENPARVAHFGPQLGLTPEQCSPRPEDLQRWLHYNERASRGEVIEYEMSTEVHGQLRDFLCIVAPLWKGGRVGGLVGFNMDVTPRKAAERLAHEKDTQLASILLQMPGGVSRLDRDLRFLFVNEAHARWFDQPPDAMLGQPLSSIVSAERLERMLPFVMRALEGEVVVFENRIVLPSGEVRWRHTTLAPERRADGEVCGFVAFAIDTTERKNMELALQQNQSRLRTLVNALPDMVFLKDAQGVYQYCNPVFERFAGLAEAAIVGRTDAELFSPEAAESFRAHDLQTLQLKTALTYEEDMVFADGHRGRFETIQTPIEGGDGQLTGVLGVARDITDRKRAEREIERLAFFDALTDLPNRRLLLDRLQQACLASTRSGQHGALLFLDLDNFKDLNDTMGHGTGDQLLIQVGRRLASSVRQVDTVSRFGGDEFVLMLEELSPDWTEATEQAERVAEKVLVSMNQPFELKGLQHYSTPSIGITLFVGDQTPIDELLKRADLAMYQAKAHGRNTLRFFDPQMQAAATARSVLEGDLRQGLLRQELLLYYQPVVNDRQRITGVEALVRWAHPQRGMVSPAEFIPLAEQTGLILPLGQWVLEQACAQLVQWAAREETRDLTLSVNVSARQFRHPDFVRLVLDTLDQTGANPRCLQLELTESLLLTDVEDMIAKMTELRMEGLRFSLDDFGTGYSSLSYLKRLPLDQLKIDQSFVRDVLVDPNDAAIVRTILALAGSLDLAVVAEGVETGGQLDFLRQSGCRAFQGYLFGRPSPVDVLEQAQGLNPSDATAHGTIHG
ncbi:EAL domain-containing protein [Curvibacter sp. HBC28]|uniref:EAL domain-containing protein n=1 Tax=Curvibacter microcysteis TaxID=3026419 RepID=A0ABT5MGF6_9BURK|nr:EAL domain-containing protein [Curvibacter sp. HBC28]MDD0815667.1 EAL domain-containing protein [Curvibacter sp. HBC28]